MSYRHEVVVVGSRCAGAATALLLARLGHDVALIDRSTFPSDTLSTHAISRAGVVQLSRWGLLDEVLGTGAPAVRHVSFVLPAGERVDRALKSGAGVDLLVAPRRYALDSVLRDAAASAGVTLYTGSVSDVRRDGAGRVVGVVARTADGADLTIDARCVVAADGRNSRLADRLGAATRHRSISPAGTVYSYVAGLDATGFEFHLADQALVGVFPTHDDQACVWVCAPAPDLQPLLTAGTAKGSALRDLITTRAPALADRLTGCSIEGVRGAVRLPNVLRQPAGPGWVLIGDAGYHRDPVTGHGITDAFRDAELAARAVHRWLVGELSEETAGRTYDTARTLAVREIFAITRALTTFPAVRRFAALQKQLSQAIEREAHTLAALPPIDQPALAA